MSFEIPQRELDKISEYVLKGITASKQSDSNFWSEVRQDMLTFKSHILNYDSRSSRIEEIIMEIRDYQKLQNGRVEKLEDRVIIIDKEISFSKGTIKVIGIVIGVLMTILGFFAQKIINIGEIISKLQ